MKPPLKPSLSSTAPAREEIDALKSILRDRSLQLVFQPIFENKTGKLFGLEALARSPSPLFAGPLELYSAASSAGLVGSLGHLQRKMAIRLAPARPLFINVHPSEFDEPYLVRPDDPLFLHSEEVYLEVTESAPLSYFEQCNSVLGELRRKGIRIAVDDFGAGFSNVKYIADLAPDIVKLDRELIRDVRHGSRQFRLLMSIVRLCKDMGARVVAEGIETSEEFVLAEHAGVDYCQGYLLGRPSEKPEDTSWPGFPS